MISSTCVMGPVFECEPLIIALGDGIDNMVLVCATYRC